MAPIALITLTGRARVGAQISPTTTAGRDGTAVAKAAGGVAEEEAALARTTGPGKVPPCFSSQLSARTLLLPSGKPGMTISAARLVGSRETDSRNTLKR